MMMNLLLIDNDSDTLNELEALCHTAGHSVTTLHRKDIAGKATYGYDATVLSGGYWYDDATAHLEAYQAEIDFIRTSPIPMVGICLGMQLMHVAHSGDVPLLDEPQTGPKHIDVNPRGQLLLGLPATLEVHKNHTRGVRKVSDDFEVLADSPGHVEIMHHKTKPLVGVQFHPEVGDTATGVEILSTLLVCAAKDCPAFQVTT